MGTVQQRSLTSCCLTFHHRRSLLQRLSRLEMRTRHFLSLNASLRYEITWRQVLRLRCLHRNWMTRLDAVQSQLGIRNLTTLPRNSMDINMASCSSRRLYSTSSPSGSEKSTSEQDENDDEDDERKENRRLGLLLVGLGALVSGLTVSFLTSRSGQNMDEEGRMKTFVSWNTFLYQMLAQGEVQRIVVTRSLNNKDGEARIELYPSAVIDGYKVRHGVYYMTIRDIDRFEAMLREAEKRLRIDPLKSTNLVYDINYSRAWTGLMVYLALIALGIYGLVRFNRYIAGQMSSFMDQFTKANVTKIDKRFGQGKAPKVKFKDVAGLKEAKLEVVEFVDYLKNPQRFTVLGAKLPKGGLLLGPPGCGKTLLAKAVAAEAHVPFFAVNGTDFVEMIGGLGASRVRSLFKQAKQSAPCIIHIDEIDALGRQRGGEVGGPRGNMDNSEHEQTLNQLLVEMDGMETNQGVLLLASTNRADILDKALLRRGRFDRHINIDLPTRADRVEIFELYMKQLTLRTDAWKTLGRLADMTPGFSGADIKNVCNEAALMAAKNGDESVTAQNLAAALERVVSGPEKRSTAMSPEEREMVAYHEAGHALVSWLLKETDALLKISIVPRTISALGYTRSVPREVKLFTKQQLDERIAMTLGGRAAEMIVFNKFSTGAEDDLKKVTQIAYSQVRNYGMNEKVGLLSFAQSGEFERKPYSKKLQALIDLEARQVVSRAYDIAVNLIQQQRNKLDTLAKALLEKESLQYEDVRTLIGPPPHGDKSTVASVEDSLPPPDEEV